MDVIVLGIGIWAMRRGASDDLAGYLLGGRDVGPLVTALTLHSDPAHVAGNAFFGALFVAGVCQLLGTGTALFAVLVVDAAGNGMNAWLQGAGHASIGASTAAFGALGILATGLWRLRARQRRLRRWTPLVIAILLLGYLGTSGERTDVLGHVTGFGAGLVLGATLRRPPTWAQWLLGAAALGVVATAWAFASHLVK